MESYVKCMSSINLSKALFSKDQFGMCLPINIFKTRVLSINLVFGCISMTVDNIDDADSVNNFDTFDNVDTFDSVDTCNDVNTFDSVNDVDNHQQYRSHRWY